MNTPQQPLNSEDGGRGKVRGPDLGSARKRDVLLQRVRAARKRLHPLPGAVARVR